VGNRNHRVPPLPEGKGYKVDPDGRTREVDVKKEYKRRSSERWNRFENNIKREVDNYRDVWNQLRGKKQEENQDNTQQPRD